MLIHVIRPGDTMWSIARRYGVPVESVIEANRWMSPERLQIGMRLLIPHPSPLAVAEVVRYPVQPGDTVWSIAWRFGVPMQTIMLANHITPPYTLQVGQEILVPMTTAY